MIIPAKTKNKLVLVLIIAAIVWFVFLCLLNYFAQEPRMDEDEILRNIKELSVPQLFGDLKYNQVFPRAYLALISIFSSLFSYNILSLRFFPLLFMLIGFFLWIYIYKQESKTNFYLFLLIFSFSSSIFMTDYAAYLKQYSLDLCAVAVFTAFIYYQKKYFEQKAPLKYLWLFSIFTPFLIMFSQMSFLLFWVIAYNYLFFLRKNKEIRRPFIVYAGLCAIFCSLLYYFDIQYSLKVKFMQSYWNNAFIDISSLYNFMKSFTNGLQNLMVRWFLEEKIAKSIANVFMPFALFAICRSLWSSLKAHKGKVLDINALCGILIAELFFLGVMRMYPFTGSRVTLFIAPFIFYMIVKGIYLTERIKLIFYSLLSFYILFLSGISYSLLMFYLDFYKR